MIDLFERSAGAPSETMDAMSATKIEAKTLATYCLNVPQARAARLTKESLERGIKELYTDGVSICHIVILIGKNKISLIHADLKTPTAYVDEEIELMGEAHDKIILYREERVAQFMDISRRSDHHDPKKFIGNFWAQQQMGMGEEWQLCHLRPEDDGILVGFSKQNGHRFHKNIRLVSLSEVSQNLLRHPKEKIFNSVQKIEDAICIGFKVKHKVIFDGIHWEVVPEEELSIFFENREKGGKYLDFLSVEKGCMRVIDRLSAVIVSIREENKQIKFFQGEMDVAYAVASFVQDCLYKEDTPDSLLRADIWDLINDCKRMKKNPENFADEEILKYINQVSVSEEINFSRIKERITKYDLSSQSKFKKFIIGSFEPLERFYVYRSNYLESAQLYSSKNKLIRKVTAASLKKYEKGDIESALQLLRSILPEVSQCYLKSDLAIRRIYGNIASFLYKLGRCEEAIPYLKLTLKLHQKYPSSPVTNVDKYKSMLKDSLSRVITAIKDETKGISGTSSTLSASSEVVSSESLSVVKDVLSQIFFKVTRSPEDISPPLPGVLLDEEEETAQIVPE